MRTIITLSLLFLLASCQSQNEKPNVIILMTDDQGYGDLSIHGHPYLQTPNMDQLHDASISFTNFHVAPVCTPTRSQLMTGMDALRTNAFSPHGQFHLMRQDYTTMADIFLKNGYRTALYGKWHLGGNSIGYRPHERGFEDAVHFLRGGHWSHPNPWNSDCMDDYYYHNGVLEKFEGYANDIWFDLGKEFITECVSEDKPFFLYLPVNAPHIPWLVPEKYREPYLDKGLDDKSVNFFAMIGTVDERLGDLLGFLEQKSLRDNTIFIFLTDNGSTLFQQDYNAGMRGFKGSLYEGGHRVPCFISWPAGELVQPTEIEQITICQDILPTLIDLCELELEEPVDFNGISIAGLLRGTEQPELEDRVEIIQVSMDQFEGVVMHKNWRLVNGLDLYNLETDPAQEINLADQHPEVVSNLLSEYNRWWMPIEPEGIPEPYYIDGTEEVMLTAYDWYDGDRIYNWPHLRAGEKSNGQYYVIFTEGGEYSFSLRRWPREADAGITESVPAFTPFDPFLGSLEEGVALDIVMAYLAVGEEGQEAEVLPGDKEVVFNMFVPEGECIIQTFFMDRRGEVFGAYYLYINKTD